MIATGHTSMRVCMRLSVAAAGYCVWGAPVRVQDVHGCASSNEVLTVHIWGMLACPTMRDVYTQVQCGMDVMGMGVDVDVAMQCGDAKC